MSMPRFSRVHGLALLSLIAAAPASAQSFGLNGAPCAMTSLQAAINTASSGDVVVIATQSSSGVPLVHALGATVLVNGTNLTITSGDSTCATPVGFTGTARLTAGTGLVPLTDTYMLSVAGGSEVTLERLDIDGSDQAQPLDISDSEVTLVDTDLHHGVSTLDPDGGCVTARRSQGTGDFASLAGIDVEIPLDPAFQFVPGLVMRGSSQVHDCLGTENHGGGGVMAWGGAVFLYDDAAIRNGTSTVSGGNVALWNGSDLELHDRSVLEGGVADGTNLTGIANVGMGGNVFASGSLDLGFQAAAGPFVSRVKLFDEASITGGEAWVAGGGVAIVGDSTVQLWDDSTIHDNVSLDDGGGIAALAKVGDTPVVHLQDRSELRDNLADRDGGGLWAEGAHVVLEDEASTHSNEALRHGGGADLEDCQVTLADTAVIGGPQAGNLAHESGGGLAAKSSTIDVDGTTWTVPTTTGSAQGGVRVEHNTALNTSGVAEGGGGGLLLLDGSTLVGSALVVRGNTGHDAALGAAAVGVGGGILVTGGASVNLDDTSVEGNRANSAGGGLWLDGGSVTLTAGAECDLGALPADRYCSEIRANSTNGPGGAAHLQGTSTLTLNRTALKANHASGEGAAIHSADSGVTSLFTSVLSDQTSAAGSTIFIGNGADLNSIRSTFADEALAIDLVAGSGGQLRQSVIWDDSAAGGGPGLVLGGAFTGSCNIGSGVAALVGVDNVAVDPLYVADPVRGGFYLDPASAGYDASCTTSGGVDIDGNTRQGVVVDMGSFED
ncbi:MAG: hypothetical protein KTR31_33310 [Myxococcales bacterium]|nr:hypothetical protein [Myxococcales bacterium]